MSKGILGVRASHDLPKCPYSILRKLRFLLGLSEVLMGAAHLPTPQTDLNNVVLECAILQGAHSKTDCPARVLTLNY